MIKKVSPLGWIFAFLLFVLFSLVRLHNYDKIPGPAHAEELLYSWSGIWLIETGVPRSWSTLNYPEKAKVFDGLIGNKSNVHLYATLFSPWLDEPPLYSLLSGGMAHLYKDDRNDILPVSHTRIPSVLASLVTLGLVFLVTNRLFFFWPAVLAMTMYGTSIILVFGSRLSVPENIIALFVIISIWSAKNYLKLPNKRTAFFWGVISSVLGLMKPTGFFMAPIWIYFAATKKRWTDCVLIFVTTLLGIGLFAMYGYYFDWEIFKTIVATQGVRFAGWSGLSYILTSPAYDIFTTNDGWYVFALFASMFYVFKKNKDNNLWIVSMIFCYWLFVGLLSGTEGDLLPWYRYPIFPVMAILGGNLLFELIKKADFFSTSMVVGLMLSSRYQLMNAFRPTTPPNTFRITFLLVLLPSLAYVIWKKRWMRKISRWVIIFFIVLGTWYNLKYIYNAFEIRCESVSCPFSKSSFLSEVRVPFFWRFLVMKDSTDMLTTKRPWF